MSLEQELRHALRRTDPPLGFDDRVLSRIAAGETVPMVQPHSRWAHVGLPIAASLMLAVGATYYVQQQQMTRQEQAQAAARDVVLALQIASETVSAAQAKVEEITRYEPTNDH
jgi:hypothetical protein